MTTKYKQEKQELIKLASLQQREAANPKMSVWVEASAGTGKTKVLSDRVLRLLLAKVAPAKILCLTYTKAAAVEMNERIAKRLSSWAVMEENDLEKEISDLLGTEYQTQNKTALLSFARTLFAVLLDTPGGMKIQTIHSFCQDVLKRFPLEAGISPYFDVLDDRNAKEILQNIKTELLKSVDDNIEDESAKAIRYLTQTVSEFKFPEIMNMITENRSKIDLLLKKHKGNICRIIPFLENQLGVSVKISAIEIKNELFKNIDHVRFKLAMDAFRQGGKEDLKRAETFAQISNCDFVADCYDAYKLIFLTKDGAARAKVATKSAVKIYPDIEDFIAQETERLLWCENKLAALNVLHSTISVLYIAKNIIDKYNAYKQIYSVLDYEDLIIITRNLLENSNVADWVLFKLDGGIEHILIDEAQDTSPNQWAIIRALTQEFFAGLGSHENDLQRTVFVVGDRKQSIYSFQGADPKEFDKMYRYFNERIQNFSKIHLDVSFRSTKAVMDCVNILFDNECAKKGVVPEGEKINHRPFRLGEGGKVEVFPLLKEDTADKTPDYNWLLPVNPEQKTSLSNTLAKQIAQNIKDIVESGEILASKNRPVRYGDFMFLVQQRNAFVEEFVRACKDKGVSVAGVDKLKLLEQIAVMDLISLGKFLLLPADDLSLAEILKSPIFGLNDDDLFDLCYKREGTLFSNLLKNHKYFHISETLKNLLNMAGYARPFELFNFVLVNLKGRKNFIARMGNDVEDVIDEFLNLTLVFEQKHTPSLEAFIFWIGQDEVIVQKEMEQGQSDTVKIMTVHGSKGLQAPIVILADTTRIKNQALKSELLWNNDDEVYFPACAADYDEMCTSIRKKKAEADFDEYRRLLYVALTRAEDRLYIAGFTKGKDANENSWYKLLENNLSSNVILPENDKRIVYEVPQENECESVEKICSPVLTMPDYSAILTPAPVESPLAKPYAPSKGESDETELAASPLEDNGSFYRRGTVIHKLLQYITSVAPNERPAVALLFLEKQLPDFSDFARRQIVDEVLLLCDTYADIFTASSKAEVPIVGEIDGKIISAKIDRLVINSDKVVIVDYKTNRPAAKTLDEVPEIYRKQLATYKNLLKKLYPEKEIETYLLWTNTCNMMKL